MARARYRTIGLQLAIAIVVMLVSLVLPEGSSGASASHLAEPIPVPATVQFRSTPLAGYTPQEIRRAYRFDRTNLDGSGTRIAIVTAFDVPGIESDANTFSSTFSLPGLIDGRASQCTARLGPHPCLERVAGPEVPAGPEDWALDATMAVEWTHAIVPGADILLVLAPRATFESLAQGVDLAVARGAQIVVMSWASAEFSDETSYDRHFQAPGVTFVAAAGDRPGVVTYPAASPWVIAVGGTTLELDEAGAIQREVPWPDSGWGASDYEQSLPDPTSRSCVTPSGRRSVPDVAYSADPRFGFAVYKSATSLGWNGWIQLGGTSAGAPQWAGLLALARQRPGAKLTGAVNLMPQLDRLATLAGSQSTFRASSDHLGDPTCPTRSGQIRHARTGLGSPVADRLIRWLGLPS